MLSQRNLLRLLLAASALFYLIFIFRTSFNIHGQRAFTLVDDAMISMRYARNLAQGQGLVWNIGQAPVQGFTNLGWVLVMALVHLFPFSPTIVSLPLMLIGLLILLANIFVVFQIVSTLDTSARFAPLIAATITAFYFPLVFWTLRGLEVGALTLTLSIALLLAFRLTRDFHPATVLWLTLYLSLALLIRMDAALPVALILIYLASKNRQAATPPAIVSILVFVGILLFQKSYFGDFLPNTYYLKVYGVTAWERVRVGMQSLISFALRDFSLLLIVALIGIGAFKSLRSREMFLLLLLFLAQIGYSVWVGGDYAEDLVKSANRFIAQGMPALFILFAMVIERFIEKVITSLFEKGDPQNMGAGGMEVKGIFALAIIIDMLFISSGMAWGNWVNRNSPMLPTDIQRARIGLHINEYTDPSAVIAVHAAGQIPYFSERTIIDLLGKNDPVIAKGAPVTSFFPGHNKWNYEYSILQLKPDIIADNFKPLAGFMENVTEYRQLENGIYVRVNSTLVNLAGLSLEYK